MEGLIEALIEVFGEVILEILGSVIGNFVKVIDTDRKVKKAVKYIIAFIFFGASITLLTLSLIYKKSLLVILTVSYMLIMLILHLLKFTNKNIINNKKMMLAINWIKRIMHYAFPIVLIIFGRLSLESKESRGWLIGCSIAAMVILLCIDIYRLVKYFRSDAGRVIHKIKIESKEFDSIANEKQSIYSSVNFDKYKDIKINDYIEFKNKKNHKTVIVKVKKIYLFKSFEEVYSFYDKTKLGYEENEYANPLDMLFYNSQYDVDQYGVIAIEFLVNGK